MRIHHFLFLISFIFLFSLGFSLNLALTDYHNPQANHILDAEIVGDVLIVSAMVQGIEFYDISNPGNLNHLTNFNLSGNETFLNISSYFTQGQPLYMLLYA